MHEMRLFDYHHENQIDTLSVFPALRALGLGHSESAFYSNQCTSWTAGAASYSTLACAIIALVIWRTRPDSRDKK
jgi:hypothetical protein